MRSDFNIIVFILLICVLTSCKSSKLEGKADNWQSDKTMLLAIGTKSPVIIGTIDANGFLKIILDNALVNTIKADNAKVEKEFNASHANGFEIKAQTFADKFPYCKDSLDYLNPKTPIISAAIRGTMAIWDPSTNTAYGSISMVSSKDFHTALSNYDASNLISGYYIEFYYMEEMAAVKGKCQSAMVQISDQETARVMIEYNLELKPGWNIVRTEMKNMVTDIYNQKYPLTTSFHSIKKLPHDVTWVIANTKK